MAATVAAAVKTNKGEEGGRRFYSLDKQLAFTDHLLFQKRAFQRVCSRCTAIWNSSSLDMSILQKKRILRQHTMAAFAQTMYDVAICKGNYYLGLCPQDEVIRWYVLHAYWFRGLEVASGFSSPVTPPDFRPVLNVFCQNLAAFVDKTVAATTATVSTTTTIVKTRD